MVNIKALKLVDEIKKSESGQLEISYLKNKLKLNDVSLNKTIRYAKRLGWIKYNKNAGTVTIEKEGFKVGYKIFIIKRIGIIIPIIVAIISLPIFYPQQPSIIIENDESKESPLLIADYVCSQMTKGENKINFIIENVGDFRTSYDIRFFCENCTIKTPYFYDCREYKSECIEGTFLILKKDKQNYHMFLKPDEDAKSFDFSIFLYWEGKMNTGGTCHYKLDNQIYKAH